MHDTADVGLAFPKLAGPLRLVCYADASFAGNVDHSSQLGCLLMLVDSVNNAHILNWFSRKSSRVTDSILAAETLLYRRCGRRVRDAPAAGSHGH
jgi:hypothetical protein